MDNVKTSLRDLHHGVLLPCLSCGRQNCFGISQLTHGGVTVAQSTTLNRFKYFKVQTFARTQTNITNIIIIFIFIAVNIFVLTIFVPRAFLISLRQDFISSFSVLFALTSSRTVFGSTDEATVTTARSNDDTENTYRSYTD